MARSIKTLSREVDKFETSRGVTTMGKFDAFCAAHPEHSRRFWMCAWADGVNSELGKMPASLRAALIA